jgi:hypothetical protein
VTRPPKPTEYKHGDTHQPTGRIFSSYYWNAKRWYTCLYQSKTKKDAHIEIMYNSALQRARRDKIPFDIDIEYLKSIKTDRCPIFDMELTWGEFGDDYKRSANSPSLDKIKPEYGYIKGNVCIISDLANKIKQDVGYKELYKVADWLHEKYKEVEKNVRPEQLASVPKKSRKSGKDDSQLGFVFTAGPWEDSDDANDYRGAVQGENTYRSAKEGSGDSMGRRGKEMGTPTTPKDSKDIGHTESTVNSVEEFFERVHSKSRELDLVTGATRDAIQQSDHRRIESLQRPLDEAFQELEKTLKELREAHYFDRNADTTRDG